MSVNSAPVLKKKHRWTFEIPGFLKPFFVKLPSRPILKIQEVEEDGSLNIVEGSQQWEPFTAELIDVEDPVVDSLFKLINLEFQNKEDSFTTYNMICKLWDGCGNLLESWEFLDAIFLNVNFGNCGSETIEFTIQFKGVEYKNGINPGIEVRTTYTSAYGHKIELNDMPEKIKLPEPNFPDIQIPELIGEMPLNLPFILGGPMNLPPHIVFTEIPSEIKILTDNIPSEIKIPDEITYVKMGNIIITDKILPCDNQTSGPEQVINPNPQNDIL